MDQVIERAASAERLDDLPQLAEIALLIEQVAFMRRAPHLFHEGESDGIPDFVA